MFNPLKIQIHIWGGLGSQLYGLNCYFKLANLYENRKFNLVFHSSGESRRTIEFNQNKLNKCKIIFKDDFQSISKKSYLEKTTLKKIVIPIKQLAFKILIFTHVVVKIENEADLLKLKVWTTDVRGHYSYLTVDKKELVKLKELGTQLPKDFFSEKSFIGVHLRLGDLLTIESKNEINPFRFRTVIKKIVESPRIKLPILVFSDTDLDSEIKLRQKYFDGFEIDFLNCETKEVLYWLSRSKVFLGTTSKISIWVAYFFSTNKGFDVYLPFELQPIIEKNIATNSFKYY